MQMKDDEQACLDVLDAVAKLNDALCYAASLNLEVILNSNSTETYGHVVPMTQYKATINKRLAG